MIFPISLRTKTFFLSNKIFLSSFYKIRIPFSFKYKISLLKKKLHFYWRMVTPQHQKEHFFLIKISSVFYTKNKPIVSSLLLMPPAHVMVEIDISFSLSLSSCYRSLRSCIDERQSSRSTFRTPSNIKNRTY